MHQILVALVCVLFVVGTNGASVKLSTSIDENAIELARLIEKFWSSKPAVLLNHPPLAICRFIDDCCEGEKRLKAISLMISLVLHRADSLSFPKVTNTCIDSTVLNKTEQTCLSLQQFNSMQLPNIKDPAVEQFFSVTMKYNTELIKLRDHIEDSCTDYEFHAFLCLTDKNLLQSCTAKILQGIHNKDGYKAYYKFMMQTKQSLTRINQILAHDTVKNIKRN